MTVTSPWEKTCKHWVKSEGCHRGISCWHRHLGQRSSSGWCAICGSESHTTMTCIRPGGGHDPDRHQVWCEYRKSTPMKKFLSELNPPSKRRKTEVSIYVMRGVPPHRSQVEQRVLTRTGPTSCVDPTSGSESLM